MSDALILAILNAINALPEGDLKQEGVGIFSELLRLPDLDEGGTTPADEGVGTEGDDLDYWWSQGRE